MSNLISSIPAIHMTVYLLGVSHDFQQHASSDFVDHILDLHKTYKFLSIGEEMNHDALSDAHTNISVPKSVADSLGLRHEYCDPDQQEREYLGIRGDHEIECSQWHTGISNEQKDELIATNHALREIIWLERISQRLISPILFICGADHLYSFQALLKKHSHECCVIEKIFSNCSRKHPETNIQTNQADHLTRRKRRDGNR